MLEMQLQDRSDNSKYGAVEEAVDTWLSLVVRDCYSIRVLYCSYVFAS